VPAAGSDARARRPWGGGSLVIHTLQLIWTGLALAGLAFFLDTPLRTFERGYTVNLWRARLALLTVELHLVAMWAAARMLMGWEIPIHPPGAEWAMGVAGLGLSIAGAALAVWAKLRLGRWFSATFAIKEGHELVTDGPYAVTRHPIYTGVIATMLGGALVWNSGTTLLLTLALAVPLFLHTVYEESMFEKHFGAPYFEYERRVPRLVPFLRPRGRR
jgi:protein-S-isoprenylcysteine O-methyltransferase Ste14